MFINFVDLIIIGQKIKSARRDAAYRAALVLYPGAQNTNEPVPAITERFLHSHCTKISNNSDAET